jgi:hypothetical protein
MLEQLPTGALTTSYTLGTGRGKFWNLEQRRDDVVEENVLLVTLGDVPTIDRAFGLIDTSLRVPGGTQPDDRILESLYNVINRRPAAETYVIAMTSTTNALLPAFSSFPSYNPTTQRISWIEALGGVAPDLTVARITVSHGGARLQWTLAAPHTPGEVTFPTLPSDVADFTPVAGDQVLDLRLVNAKVPGHYDGVRAHILDAHLEEGDRSGTALATAGNVVTVEATIPVPDPGPFLREAPGREPLVDPLRSVR